MGRPAVPAMARAWDPERMDILLLLADLETSLGFDGAEPLLFEGLDAAPGVDLDVTFRSGDGDTIVYSVPVLDGALRYLEEFVPES